MNNLEINKMLVENIKNLSDCYLDKCNSQLKKQKKFKNKIQNMQNIIFDKYEKGEISKLDAKRIINELEDKYNANINARIFFNCKLKNCKELLIENLELLLLRLNKLDKYNDLYETQKENYDIDDYINIKKLNTKFHNNFF